MFSVGPSSPCGSGNGNTYVSNYIQEALLLPSMNVQSLIDV